MFLPNKYTTIYFRIIEKAVHRDHKRVKGDGFQTHHIVPKSLGGSNKKCNLVVLSYKEHRVCHKLLIQMTEGVDQNKMRYAYKLFNSNYDLSGTVPLSPMTKERAERGAKTRKQKGSYKTGKENNFAQPEIIDLVRKRMKANNPMKDPLQRERMRRKNNNPHVKQIVVNDLRFFSLSDAARHFNTSPHVIKKAMENNICVEESQRMFEKNTKVVIAGMEFASKKHAMAHFNCTRKSINIAIETDSLPCTIK